MTLTTLTVTTQAGEWSCTVDTNHMNDHEREAYIALLALAAQRGQQPQPDELEEDA